MSTSAKDWAEWDSDLSGLPDVKREGGTIEFPTTHLWVDLDCAKGVELVWFYHKVSSESLIQPSPNPHLTPGVELLIRLYPAH